MPRIDLQNSGDKKSTYYLSAFGVTTHRKEQTFALYLAFIVPILHSRLFNKGARNADSLLVYVCCHSWLFLSSNDGYNLPIWCNFMGKITFIFKRRYI